jgi:hypothetical protein
MDGPSYEYKTDARLVALGPPLMLSDCRGLSWPLQPVSSVIVTMYEASVLFAFVFFWRKTLTLRTYTVYQIPK